MYVIPVSMFTALLCASFAMATPVMAYMMVRGLPENEEE